MERKTLKHGFGPFYRPDSRLMILGSFPSVKSREANFFYGHPQNRFWPVMARLCREATPNTLEQKEAFLARNQIALYDVIEECSIVGSSDSTIRDVVPADLSPILRDSQVGDRIFVNGGKADALYQKHLYPILQIRAIKLPSTSPANAAYSLDKLVQLWGMELNSIVRRDL